MNIASILLMAPQGQAGQGGGGLSFFIMIGAMILVFYFFMIRPQTKKAKEAAKFREALKKGDKIVTIGGIHGKILEVTDTTLLIESEGSKLRIDKNSISAEQTQTANKE